MFTLLTFNIRTAARDKFCWNTHYWRKRIDNLVYHITKHNPDVICLQEVTKLQYRYLKKHLKDYNFYCTTFKKYKLWPEIQPILVKNTYKVTDKSFPSHKGFKMNSVNCVEIDGINVLNVHLPLDSSLRLTEFTYNYCTTCPQIIAGDFNEPYGYTLSKKIECLGYYPIVTDHLTFHKYGETKACIDNVYTTKNIQCILKDISMTNWCSDHYGILTEIQYHKY